MVTCRSLELSFHLGIAHGYCNLVAGSLYTDWEDVIRVLIGCLGPLLLESLILNPPQKASHWLIEKLNLIFFFKSRIISQTVFELTV